MDAKDKRSIILLGRSHAGKTSLSESILYHCKAISRKGTITEGNTASDYSWDEIERKISINDSFLFCDYRNVRVQIVDSPGYIDFYGEVLSGIRAVDNVVLVVDANSGVDVVTEKVWNLAQENGLPCIIFVNKSDAPGINKNKITDDIKVSLSKKAVTLDDSSALMELVAESDDGLLEKYLGTGSLSAEEINNGLRKAVINAKAFPVIFGSSLKDEGIEELLRVINEYAASPLERAPVELNEGKITFSPLEGFSGFVFKSIIDPYVGQLSLVRIFSGKLTANTRFYLPALPYLPCLSKARRTSSILLCHLLLLAALLDWL